MQLALIGGIATLGLCAAWRASRARHEPNGEPSVPQAPTYAPATAPPGLWMRGQLPAPNQSWKLLQRQVGGAAGLLPSSAAGLFGAFTGLGVGIEAELDTSRSMPFAASITTGVVTGALCMRITAPAQLAKRLWEAPNAAYEALPNRDGRTALVDKREIGGPALAVDERCLYVASSAATIDALAPTLRAELARTVSNEPALFAELAENAGANVLQPWLQARFDAVAAEQRAALAAEQIRHAGRPADLADPEALLGIAMEQASRASGYVGTLQTATLRLDLAAESMRLRADAIHNAPGKAAALALGAGSEGDADRELRRAPTTDELQCVQFASSAERASVADDLLGGVLRALGKRATAAEGERMRAAWSAFQAARGDVLWIGAARGESGARGPRLAVRTQASSVQTHEIAESVLSIAHLASTLKLRRRPLTLEAIAPWTTAQAEQLELPAVGVGQPARSAEWGLAAAGADTWSWLEWTRPAKVGRQSPAAGEKIARIDAHFPQLAELPAAPRATAADAPELSVLRRARGACRIELAGTQTAATRATASYGMHDGNPWAQLDADAGWIQFAAKFLMNQ